MSDPFPAAQNFIDTARRAEQSGLGLGDVAGLRRGETTGPSEFTFEDLGFVFAVRAGSSQQRTHMSFRANFGSLPCTAEDQVARAHATAVLASAGYSG